MMLELAIGCMALNIFWEARSEPFAGQLGVAYTTYKRANYDYANICNTVYKPDQFTWTSEPQKLQPLLKNPIERQAWQRARAIAENFTNFSDPTDGADHYHVRPGCPGGVRPRWTAKMKKTRTIGCHIFYRSKP